jgi:hypothetical protein
MWNSQSLMFVISGFRRDVDEICTLLRCYAASSGNPLPTFRDNLTVPSNEALDFLTLEDGTDTSSRNVGKGLPLDAALHPRRAQISKLHVVWVAVRKKEQSVRKKLVSKT